jgi:hypothetical protein
VEQFQRRKRKRRRRRRRRRRVCSQKRVAPEIIE